MTETSSPENEAEPSGIHRYVPLLIYTVLVLTFLCIPLKIISYGYLPVDDALRHAAKAVSGKPWSDILVLGPAYKVDHNFGWHLFLGKIHQATGCGPETLVVIEVVLLFTLLGWCAIPWLKRPEAWLLAMLIFMVGGGAFMRFLLGRPFLLSIFMLLTILFLWRQREPNPPGWKHGLFMTGLITLAIFVHGVWYLWSLPLLAFVLAREYRWALVFGCSWLAGTVLGAALTGHPVDYIIGAMHMAITAFAAHPTSRTQVSEFQPGSGDFASLTVLVGLILLRRLAPLQVKPLTSNPAFWLCVTGWVLGFKAVRFWSDWGWPALLFLAACDLQRFLQLRFKPHSTQRLGLVCGVALAAYLASTNDIGSRWSWSLTKTYSYLKKSDPEVAEWLPDKGGILYSGNMITFFDTFFKNPDGDWRYILGYEPVIMPREDFEVYHKIIWNFGDVKTYQPWVDKMRPEDRLIMYGGKESKPNLPELEWHYTISGTWLGRVPRTNGMAGLSNSTNATLVP